MLNSIIDLNDPVDVIDCIAKPGCGKKLLASFGGLQRLSEATLDDLRQTRLLSPPQAYRLLAAFALVRLIANLK